MVCVLDDLQGYLIHYQTQVSFTVDLTLVKEPVEVSAVY